MCFHIICKYMKELFEETTFYEDIQVEFVKFK